MLPPPISQNLSRFSSRLCSMARTPSSSSLRHGFSSPSGTNTMRRRTTRCSGSPTSCLSWPPLCVFSPFLHYYVRTLINILLYITCICSKHIGVNFTRIIKAFIIFKNEPGGPAAFFNELSEFTQIFGSTIYIGQTLIGDGVAMYRCYLVWGRQFRVIAIPAFLLLGSTASGIGILYSFAKVVPEADIFVTELQHWITAFFSLTLATNLLCTALVALRIWAVNRAVLRGLAGGAGLRRSYRPVLFLVLESGAVYSATLTALLVLYKTSSWFQYVLLDAISSIVGLVFSMIIVRIGLGITTLEGSATGASATTSGLGSKSFPHHHHNQRKREEQHGRSLNIVFNNHTPAAQDDAESMVYYAGRTTTTGTVGSGALTESGGSTFGEKDKDAVVKVTELGRERRVSSHSGSSGSGSRSEGLDENREALSLNEKALSVLGTEEV
ncbi:hypothetical protein SCHPADRAFT_447293 [Schizopora paradoxa]|uniref:Uncharacterized protein n=1 Tax=Schizopora paradoxa TaxID=27342 RepID=A0A0H2RR73_9AGAM|nr:hypothetical protein SCHPADRAFT_447293 [Schizopora paradoxa]